MTAIYLLAAIGITLGITAWLGFAIVGQVVGCVGLQR